MTFIVNKIYVNHCRQFLAVFTVFCLAQSFSKPELCSSQVYTWQEPSENGTGKIYCGREIASIMSTQNASWLERKDREPIEKPDEVISSMSLRPTDVVADIGAGIGYLSVKLSKLVSLGQVFAVDVQEKMLDILKMRINELGEYNIVPILGNVTNPNLPDGIVNAVLIFDSYHEFSHPYEMITAIRDALTPDGLIFIGEYRAEDESIPIPLLHRMHEQQISKEMKIAGFKLKEKIDDLPMHHLMVFEKGE